MTFIIENDKIFINNTESKKNFLMFHLTWTEDKFYKNISELIDRGIISKKGDFLTIEKEIKRDKKKRGQKNECWEVWRFLKGYICDIRKAIKKEKIELKEDIVLNYDYEKILVVE